jgi:hypothetical protein
LRQIGKFGKAVQQQHARTAFRFEPGFQHMHAQAVDPIDKARSDRGRKRDIGKIGGCAHGAALLVTAGFMLAGVLPGVLAPTL